MQLVMIRQGVRDMPLQIDMYIVKIDRIKAMESRKVFVHWVLGNPLAQPACGAPSAQCVDESV
jgi:hypothetical protein